MASATMLHWESHTSFNEVTGMVLYHGDIWVATTGGLVRIDPGSMPGETFTNINGLGTNRLLCLRIDGRGRLWVGGRGRLIDFSDPSHPDAYLFTDRDGQPVDIFDIVSVPGGDTLWLANRLGLTVFLTGNEPGEGLILDTYSRFGDIQRDIPARRVALDVDSVWVGTDGGLAAGSRSDIRLLKAPTGWISYFPSQILPSLNDSIRGLVVQRDSVYVGTTAGMYRLDRSPAPTLVHMDLYGDSYVHNMSLMGDSILINNARGSAIYHNGVFLYMPTSGMPITNTAAGAIDGNRRYWDGNLWYGIYYPTDSGLIRYDAGGTVSIDCRHVIRAQGRIWAAFRDPGYFRLADYANGAWTTRFTFEKQINAMAVGPLGELWVATEGTGAFRISDDSITQFTITNSALSGLAGDTDFVIVRDIYCTGEAVWFANFAGKDGELVAANPFNTAQWQSYLFIGGENADNIVSVTAGQGVVYAGSAERGIHAIAYNGTPFNPGDDFRWEFTSANSGIGSDFVRALAIDGYDTLWVGTGVGLSYQSLGEIYFVNVLLPVGFGPEVGSLAFDAQGSLYAGSGKGLVIRDIATGTFEYLTATNSGLVDDNIRHLYYDRTADALWISTAGGISRLTMPYRLATQDIEEVLAYPNPFIIRYGNETVRFNYAGPAEVRIYTLSGEMVREISINGVWDGRNAKGEAVAAGVYLFTLTDREGEVGRGKILLIRE